MLKSYLKKIFEIPDQGDAREESYYSTLETLLKEAAQSFLPVRCTQTGATHRQARGLIKSNMTKRVNAFTSTTISILRDWKKTSGSTGSAAIRFAING